MTEPETHLPDCECEQFSDLYKDITGHRPRGETDHWSCQDTKQWFHENYVETRPNYYEPRHGFHGES